MTANNVLVVFSLIVSIIEVSGEDCEMETLSPCASQMVEEMMNPDFLRFAENLQAMQMNPGAPISITETDVRAVCR